MRVLHVIPSISERSGGPGHAIVPMCRALKEQGLDVLIVTTDADLDSPAAAMDDQPNVIRERQGVPTIIFPVQWGASFKYSHTLANWLIAHVKEFDVVHIHAVFNHACIAAARACRRLRVPYVVRPLGTLDPWSMKQKPMRKRFFWQVAGREMIRNAAAVQYTTSGEQGAAEDSLALNHGVVVPLGVDTNQFCDNHSEAEFTRKFPSLVGHSYILVLSRLHPKKGLDVLLDAFLPLVAEKRFAEWRLVLAGDGPAEYVKHLQQRVQSQHSGDKVLFTGWLDGSLKVSALQNASLLALPSHHENFGLCVVEALVCGTPVLVSHHVNLAPTIQAAGAGWTTKLDAEEMKKTLTSALGDPLERERRGRAGSALAQEFAWPQIAQTLHGLYQRVTAEKDSLVAN